MAGLGFHFRLHDLRECNRSLPLDKRPGTFGAAKEYWSSSGTKCGTTNHYVSGADCYIALLVYCALDHRFAWSPVPPYISLIGDLLVALGLLFTLFVFRENSFGSSTVQTFDDQKVISTGPYAIVRHPMYVGVLIMMTGVPLALGSWIGLAFLAIILPGLAWRILDEEKLLKKDLSGYIEYTQKVRYRLVPYIW